MGLQLNGTDQALSTPVSVSAPQPWTLAAWVQIPTGLHDTETILSLADASETLSYVGTNYTDSRTRAITFNPYVEARGEAAGYLLNDAATHLVVGVFGPSSVTLYVDDETPITTAWSPSGSVTYDLLAIGRKATTVGTEYSDGIFEHVAIWNRVLSAADVAALYAQISSPSDFGDLVAWLPLKDSLTDTVGTLSWTAENLSSPSYTDLGVEYGSADALTGADVTSGAPVIDTPTASTTTYTVSGVTRDVSGNVLGGCTVSLFKSGGSGVYTYVGTSTSDGTTGAYSFTTADNDPAYMVVARLAGSPNVFDVTDHLTPAGS